LFAFSRATVTSAYRSGAASFAMKYQNGTFHVLQFRKQIRTSRITSQERDEASLVELENKSVQKIVAA
jgi:hypothetical protein